MDTIELSEHFTLAEAVNSSTAIRIGIDNLPTPDQIAAMHISASGMEKVRSILGNAIHVNSWLRVEALEKVLAHGDYLGWCSLHHQPVNDASWSIYFTRKAHPKGYAVDFICPAFGTPAEIVAAIRKSGIKFDKLICEGTWVHISFAPAMRGEVLVATFNNGIPTYEVV